jgi:hypothetical protein
VPLDLGGEWHGTARVSAGISTQGGGSGRGGPVGGRRRQGPGISDQSTYTWRRQGRIDRGLQPGLTGGEKAELATAKRRIAELETELRAMRRAMELVRGVVPPKAVRGGHDDGRRTDPDLATRTGCRGRRRHGRSATPG